MPKLQFPGKALSKRFNDLNFESAQFSTDNLGLRETCEDTVPQQHDGSQRTQLQRSSLISRCTSGSPWIGVEFFLCVSVKEAFDLAPAVPMYPATCDSFVRVTLQRAGSGALPMEEAETRIITRNCYPMWEECLLFPLENVTEDTSLILRLLDKDIGRFNSFLGTVSLPLNETLSQIRRVNYETIYRMPLLDRHQSPKRGELLFGVSVVAKREYKEMRGVIANIQDPDTVHDSLRDYSLHFKLHRLTELSGLNTAVLPSLTMEISVCSYVVRKPLVGQLFGGELDTDTVEVVVPLGPAFQDGDTLKGKQRAQFGEVKVELLAGKSRLAKTQVPIWDVPIRAESGEVEPDSDSDAELERTSVPRRSTGSATSSPRHTHCPERSSATNGNSRQVTGQVEATGTTAGADRLSDGGKSPLSSSRDDFRLQQVSLSGASGVSAATRAKWDGKSYSRRMERLDRSLTRCPVAMLSMQLVKVEPGELYDSDTLTTISGNPVVDGTAAATGNDRGNDGAAEGGGVFDGVDVDSPTEVLTTPLFEGGLEVADFVVGCGPLALLKALYSDGAEVAQRVWNAEKVTKLDINQWEAEPEGNAICRRRLSYTKPAGVANVAIESEQKVLLKHGGGFVVHQYVMPNVPAAGQCVKVHTQVVGKHIGPNKTRVTAAVKMEWLKQGMMVNMVKRQIEDATPKDTRKYFDTVKAELANVKYTIEDPSSAASAAAAPGAAPAPGAAAVPVTGVAVADAGGSSTAFPSTLGGTVAGQRLPPSSKSLMVPVAVVAVVVLLLVLLWIEGSVRQIRGELQRSQRALEVMADAVHTLTGQLATVLSNGCAAGDALGVL